VAKTSLAASRDHRLQAGIHRCHLVSAKADAVNEYSNALIKK
jgi:hypothetical protein